MQEPNAWPFIEARKILDSIQNKTPEKGYVLFESGYGPSGVPHIGTFGEVARTTMVMNAFRQISDIPVKLFAFSDDMDGLRKVPTNIPNQEKLQGYIDFPLTSVPDPFEKDKSFADHNNKSLMAFLDRFGFEYEFKSSTDCYKSGEFNDAVKLVLTHYDKIMQIMLPTLREERQKNYSPIIPINPETGKVMYVQILSVSPEKGTVVYRAEDGTEKEQSVLNGNAKLQWKADWAMRWKAFDVNYEMCGADLTDSYKLSSKIVRVLGGKPPINLTYALFVDEEGQKISKSKGNGFSMEQWMEYGNPESLSLFMYKKPTTVKKLYFDQVPRHVDEYFQLLKTSYEQDGGKLKENPVWHIHGGKIPAGIEMPVAYGLLLNIASAANAQTPDELKAYIADYTKDVKDHKALDKMLGFAINYYKDYIKPFKVYKQPDDREIAVLTELMDGLKAIPESADAESAFQTFFYEVGKKHYGEQDLKAYFAMLYETLLGQKDGPRMGTFTVVYGKDKTIALLQAAIKGELVKK